MDSFKSLFFPKNKMSLIIFYFIFFSLSETTNEQSNKLYPKMIDLPNEKFLFVMVNGIYIFENNLIDKEKIYTFRGQQIIDEIEDINKTTLSDITYDDNLYVFCLVKDYLYLYDKNQNKIIKDINLNSYLDGVSYSLNPFINGTYLSCIISYGEKTNYTFSNNNYDIYKINLYEIDFLNLNESNQEYFISKKEYFNKNYVESQGKTYISNYTTTCEILNKILYCFYFVESATKVKVTEFDLRNNYEEYISNDYYYESSYRALYEIKTYRFPSITDYIIVCYYGWFYMKMTGDYKEYDYFITYCVYYQPDKKTFNKVSEEYLYNCNNVQIYFFEETNKYIIGCNDYHSGLKAFLMHYNSGYFSSGFIDDSSQYLDPLLCNDLYNYLIYYNKTSRRYNIITDCYIYNND